MAIDSLEKLLIHEIKDLYSAERQLVRALPQVAKAASSMQLAESVRQHLEETKRQATQLEEVLRMLGSNTRGDKCVAMEGLLAEAAKLIDEEELEPALLDAALVGAAQKVEHYEIAGYGTVREIARNLGRTDVAQILDQILEEEKATDQKLTELARSIVNPAALALAEDAAGEEEEEVAPARTKAQTSGAAARSRGTSGASGAAGRTSAAAAGGKASSGARAARGSGAASARDSEVGGKGGKRGSSGGADSRTRSNGGSGRTKNR